MIARRLFWICTVSAWTFLAAVLSAPAQLAITEVMSSASSTLGTNAVGSHPDFWELTNFGTNVIDLTDYRFNDSGGFQGATGEIFAGRTIAPGESIIFFQSG